MSEQQKTPDSQPETIEEARQLLHKRQERIRVLEEQVTQAESAGRRSEIAQTVEQALVEKGCTKPEALIKLMQADGTLRERDGKYLLLVDGAEVSADEIGDRYAATVPELFGGRAPARPEHSQVDIWLGELADVR